MKKKIKFINLWADPSEKGYLTLFDINIERRLILFVLFNIGFKYE